MSWSKAKQVANWPREKQQEFLDNLTPEQLAELHLQPWYWIGRPEQQLPEGEWLIWLLMTGRGFGKTRTALENFVKMMTDLPEWEGTPTQWGCIGETFSDCRNILIEGPAGLVGILNRLKIPYTYNKSLWQIVLGTGQVIHMLGADDPDVGRGYNFAGLVMDEFAKWRNGKRIWQEGLHFTLRVGPRPRAIVATTPKMGNTQLKEWIANPHVVVTEGALDDNADNLPASFIEGIAEQYAGTRLEQQERYGKLIDSVEGALWNYEMILLWRGPLPELLRTVVAIDPAISNTEHSDETGIVIASRAENGDLLVRADRTMKASPKQWAERAIEAFHEFEADRIIYEDNQGGDAWADIIHQIDPYIPVKPVRAMVGKKLRAEPIAALYEQKKVFHMAHFEKLEDQMCLIAGTLVETDRGHVPIEDLKIGDQVMTRRGLAPLKWAGQTGETAELVSVFHTQGVLVLTPCHPIFSQGKFVDARNVQPLDRLVVRHSQELTDRQSNGAADGTTECRSGTSEEANRRFSFIEQFGLLTTGRSQSATSSTILTKIQEITSCRTSRWSLRKSTLLSTTTVGGNSWTQKYDAPTRPGFGKRMKERISFALSVVKPSIRGTCERGSVPSVRVSSVTRIVCHALDTPVPVYNLTVADGHLPEFFANGVLVHNCMWEPYDPKSKSPDRVDALVHALTELNPTGSKSRFISEMMDFCPNPTCGQANNKGTLICAHCGRPMNGL